MKTVLTAVISALVGGLVAALFVVVGVRGMEDETGDVTITESTAPVSPPASSEIGASVREVYTRDGPGVVSVDVASDLGPGGGSGFVLDDSGYIVTNQHVVEGAEDISVEFASGVREEASVVGDDPSTDVALIKVDAPEAALEPLTLGDSDDVGVGEPVIAIGNPLDVGISVTTGIVSGVGRSIEAPNDYTISDAVQTDAAINPGNSGGPLLDSRGAVIGVNAQIASSSGAFQGVGFAVPINTVKNVVEQLITTGEVVHGYVGVRMSSYGVGEISAFTGLSTDELRERYDLPKNGAIVSEVVEGGPADRAGIEGGPEREIQGFPVPTGDVITRVNGEPVSTPDDVIEVVNTLTPGDRLRLTAVSPGGRPRTVDVRLDAQPEGA